MDFGRNVVESEKRGLNKWARARGKLVRNDGGKGRLKKTLGVD